MLHSDVVERFQRRCRNRPQLHVRVNGNQIVRRRALSVHAATKCRRHRSMLRHHGHVAPNFHSYGDAYHRRKGQSHGNFRLRQISRVPSLHVWLHQSRRERRLSRSRSLFVVRHPDADRKLSKRCLRPLDALRRNLHNSSQRRRRSKSLNVLSTC